MQLGPCLKVNVARWEDGRWANFAWDQAEGVNCIAELHPAEKYVDVIEMERLCDASNSDHQAARTGVKGSGIDQNDLARPRQAIRSSIATKSRSNEWTPAAVQTATGSNCVAKRLTKSSLETIKDMKAVDNVHK
ncbi:hypothetical protein M513_12839, partial [Trichuris suis]